MYYTTIGRPRFGRSYQIEPEPVVDTTTATTSLADINWEKLSDTGSDRLKLIFVISKLIFDKVMAAKNGTITKQEFEHFLASNL